jgi:hypothetical protein
MLIGAGRAGGWGASASSARRDAAPVRNGASPARGDAESTGAYAENGASLVRRRRDDVSGIVADIVQRA